MRATLAEVVLRLLPLVLLGLSAGVVIGAEWPAVDQLPEQPGLPDPLTLFDGRKVTSKEEWISLRRPELKALFAYYMYGAMPASPASVTATLDREDRRYFDGKATLKELTIAFGPTGTPPIHLLLVVPNDRKGPAPIFLGPNFHGNHTALKDPKIALPTAWVPNTKDHKASEADRGSQTDVWNIEGVIARGYALATFYCGDVAPDHPGLADGVFPHYRKPGESQPGPHDWGAVAAWAWGISRALDYLVTDHDIDKGRVVVVGHSRLGKATIVAGAYDERISLAIPHQAGCGGTAPNRIKPTTPLKHETVKRINDTFPHWFDQTFKSFNEQTDRLPFVQHCLIALVAPGRCC